MLSTRCGTLGRRAELLAALGVDGEIRDLRGLHLLVDVGEEEGEFFDSIGSWDHTDEE